MVFPFMVALSRLSLDTLPTERTLLPLGNETEMKLAGFRFPTFGFHLLTFQSYFFFAVPGR